ncbi:MAG: hypothetical protein EA402_08065 [Planctomycetota bacterium]|nr:MAG: hypothetical protein EA402_08065 [Planctomycetota bacterium]
MSAGRFSVLIRHLRRQEDDQRALLVDCDAELSRLATDRQTLAQQVAQSAVSCPPQLHEQLLIFTASCQQRDQLLATRMAEIEQRRSNIQTQLVALWRRRRSLETVDARQQRAHRAKLQARQDGSILDSAVRAWYLHEGKELEENPSSVAEYHSEALS